MARLNNIDGVTRVSLSSSGAEKVDAADRRRHRARAAQGPAVRRRQARRRSRSSPSSRRTPPPWPRRRRPRPAPSARPRLRPRRRRVGHAGAPARARLPPPPRPHAPGRGHPVSRTFRILIVAVVAFGAVGGYWKLVLAPKRAQVAELDQQVAYSAGAARPDAEPDRHLPGRARPSTRPTTPRSRGSARPSRPTTTRARWSSSSTPPPSAATSTSTASTSTAAASSDGDERRSGRRQRRRVLGDAVQLHLQRRLRDAGRLLLPPGAVRLAPGRADQGQRPPAARGEHQPDAGHRTAGRG